MHDAICITSNKAIIALTEMMAGDEVITSGVLDRLLHLSCVLNIRGRSYRLRELEDTLRTRRSISQLRQIKEKQR
ncbi:MAG: ATP-binding protein [Planctomycetota bacterium]|nr:ATP-binding protein [Planctomycetota bacterium]